MEGKEKSVFEFKRQEDGQQWQPLNDTVMGGISGSRLTITDGGTALFTGRVSLENYGGFASVRSKAGEYDLGSFAGILLRFRGDGKRYKLVLKTDDAFEGTLYQVSFETLKDTWEIVRIPFREFVPTFRGRLLNNAPPLDNRSIKTFGFLIADKQEGPFTLEIQSIAAYAA